MAGRWPGPAAPAPAGARAAPWDLTALINAAQPRAPRPERHLWLVRLLQWLRQGPAEGEEAGPTPRPVLRLRHLLNMLERNPEARAAVLGVLGRFWRETDLAALLADFGFTARRDLWGEIAARLALHLLPATPDTDDGAALFLLLFRPGDAQWLQAIDDLTLQRLAQLTAELRGLPAAAGGPQAPPPDWRAPVLQALTWLISAIRSAAFAPALRQRMEPALLADRPFEQLVRVSEALVDALQRGDALGTAQQANDLRALIDRCRAAAASVTAHLEVHGVSVHIVFEVEQLQARCDRVVALLDLALAPAPQRQLLHLLAELVRLSRERRSLRALLGRQYSLMARKVAERHAETGEHYITRTRAEYRAMLRAALGGGSVIAGTTFAKFAIAALGLAPFWAGLGAGLNYALSFLLVHLAHWTVATKQPAMTAPAMAEKLAALQAPGPAAAPAGPTPDLTSALSQGHRGDRERDREHDRRKGDAAVEGFVDEVTHLVRSQVAGIVGNLAAVVPLVLAVQGLAWWLAGRPLLPEATARYVLKSLTLLGPTAWYAAFTGVLLFASSLIAGWVENWFVYHRLDSALAHHPAIVARLGAPRAARWSAWWRANISGVAANVSLGLLLGLVPVLMAFVALPLDVRHVTLGMGQIAAAAATLGWTVLREPALWWCLAGALVTGVLNVGVSFALALMVAMRSRGIQLADRRRLYAALRRRLRQQPLRFLLPGRDGGAAPGSAAG